MRPIKTFLTASDSNPDPIKRHTRTAKIPTFVIDVVDVMRISQEQQLGEVVEHHPYAVVIQTKHMFKQSTLISVYRAIVQSHSF